MLTYLLRRIAYGVLILFGVNLLTFVLFFAVNTPDDMARLNLGGRRVTADAIQSWKAARQAPFLQRRKGRRREAHRHDLF